MSEGWSLTESDPAIFSAILTELGVRGVQVDELWSLDAAALDDLQPVYALIFLFKWVASHGKDPAKQSGKQVEPPEGTWFAHQVINNACATLALLNATMNIPSVQASPASSALKGDAGFELGEELGNLKAFSADLDPQTRGELLTNAEKVREVHNSFARSDPFHLDEPDPTSSEDAYHFITYLPIGNQVFELDGLKELPVSHGQVPSGSQWTDRARQVVEERIGMYGAGELHFNLMAITADRLSVLTSRLASIETRLPSATGAHRSALEDERAQVGEKLATEREKRERWDFDNKVRRHNHVGLAHALLVELAKAGKLESQVIDAKAKMEAKRAKRRERGMDVDEDD